MASIVLFLLFSFIAAVEPQQRTSKISLGSSLLPTGHNPYWLSPSDHFAFGFYPRDNGFSVGIWLTTTPQKTVVWTANRDDPPILTDAVLILTDDGRLVLQQGGTQEKFIAHALKRAAFASMLDSGNFVLYAADSSLIWQSFDHPTHTLLSGQLLPPGNHLISSVSETNHSSGSFVISMQYDGNLVMYPTDLISIQTAYWSTGTASTGDNVTLKLDGDGHLFLLNSSGAVANIRNKTEAGNFSMTYRLTLDADGVLRLYSFNSTLNSNWSTEWWSTDDRCRANGICGINQYCVLMDQRPFCNCLPGYVPFNAAQTTRGCFRNFSPETCVFNNENQRYTIHELENVVWSIDGTYSILSSMNLDRCNQACLDDCSCEAAVFQNQECRKQKLPLRFGRRIGNTTIFSATLIKASVEGDTTAGSPSSKSAQRKSTTKLSNRFLVASVVITSAFVALALILKIRTIHSHDRISHEEEGELTELNSYTYEKLWEATDGFCREVSEGALGKVFKGASDSGLIAVQKLENVVSGDEAGFRQWFSSVGKMKHKNVVRLNGYCHDKHRRRFGFPKSKWFLVYEYVENGSLADFLFKYDEPSWDERIRVALEIADGIKYMHEASKEIIHCDINPNNILMDEQCIPKIAYFGPPKLIHKQSIRRGTRVYNAPEWYMNQEITEKADVYSFGMVLLDIICCKSNMCYTVVKELRRFNDIKLIELDFVGDVDQQTLHRMVSIAILCIQREPSKRPSMTNVLLMLKGEIQVDCPIDDVIGPGDSIFTQCYRSKTAPTLPWFRAYVNRLIRRRVNYLPMRIV